MYDVVVIGCGIIGAAASYELSRYQLRLAVLERENDVAVGTTKANSAILHAGYDPEPSTLMAHLNVQGVSLAKELCAKLDVPYVQCGSLVVALGAEDLPKLEALYRRGSQNGVEGLRILDKAEALVLEPNLSGDIAGALFAPSAAIVNPWEYALALAETAVRNGAELFTERDVCDISRIEGGYRLTCANGERYESRCILNAAGVHSDTLHNMVAPEAFRIIPDRGEYYLLDKTEGKRVSHIVFQCPTETGKGTLVAPTVHGNLIVGPNNEPNIEKDDTATTRRGLLQVAEMAYKSVPSIRFGNSIRNFAGVRAASNIDDFIVEEVVGCQGFIDLAGIKSPGLSAAPAIAQLAVRLLGESGLPLCKKQDFLDTRHRLRLEELPLDEKTALVQVYPAYGRVICRCEGVTEGEILDALHSPIPPRTLDGVKRRCGPGMGRCQGGFCGPRVLEILSRELGIAPEAVLLGRAGTRILASETKKGAVADV